MKQNKKSPVRGERQVRKEKRNMGSIRLLLISGLVLGGLISVSRVEAGALIYQEESIPPQREEKGVVTDVFIPETYDSSAFLENYSGTGHYSTESYAYKQCTWWAYNRARDFGISYGLYMGNGSEWKNQAGYKVTSKPTVHSVVSFDAGQTLNNGYWRADSVYGHVAFVEEVYADGSILLSESGTSLDSEFTTQVVSSSEALTLSYVLGYKD